MFALEERTGIREVGSGVCPAAGAYRAQYTSRDEADSRRIMMEGSIASVTANEDADVDKVFGVNIAAHGAKVLLHTWGVGGDCAMGRSEHRRDQQRAP
jgi:hypothetical protein